MNRWLWGVLGVVALALLILAPLLLVQIGCSWLVLHLMRKLFQASATFRKMLRDPKAWAISVGPALAVGAALAGIPWFALGVLGGLVGAWPAGRRWGKDAFAMGCGSGLVSCGLVVAALLMYLFPIASGGGLDGFGAALGVGAVLVYGLFLTPLLTLLHGGLAVLGARRATRSTSIAAAVAHE